jgi:hypothetical protein
MFRELRTRLHGVHGMYTPVFDSYQSLTVIFRATDLGISHWAREKLGELEVVSMDGLSGHFCFGDIKFAKKKLWVAFSLDHVRFTNCFLSFAYADCIFVHRQTSQEPDQFEDE